MTNPVKKTYDETVESIKKRPKKGGAIATVDKYISEAIKRKMKTRALAKSAALKERRKQAIRFARIKEKMRIDRKIQARKDRRTFAVEATKTLTRIGKQSSTRRLVPQRTKKKKVTKRRKKTTRGYGYDTGGYLSFEFN